MEHKSLPHGPDLRFTEKYRVLMFQVKYLFQGKKTAICLKLAGNKGHTTHWLLYVTCIFP